MNKSTKTHLSMLRTMLTYKKMVAACDFAKNKRIWDDWQIGMKKSAILVDTEHGVVEFADYFPATVTNAEEYGEYIETLQSYKRHLAPTINQVADTMNQLAKSLLVVAALVFAILINSCIKIFETQSIKDNKLEINLPHTLAPRLVQSPAANA
jgi:hypothetical protein